ncbi:hypothetical protein Tco_0770531 [Tanacetum coccineum]|uniref:Transposase n=1 Tax=Tanacetum coccineum TaxID=301880 RepID=A0ABQ4ZFV2_9ASTR
MGIQQHLQKIYNGKKAALKERYWVPEEDRTYDLERLRRGRPSYISEVDWDAQLAFWNDPKNLARAAQNKQNRAKSKVMETLATREYPSLIHTFFLTHTIGGVFLNPEDKALYDEMMRLQGVGSNTETGVPYTEDEIIAIVHEGEEKAIGGTFSCCRGFARTHATVICPSPPCNTSLNVAKLKKREKEMIEGRRRGCGDVRTIVRRMLGLFPGDMSPVERLNQNLLRSTIPGDMSPGKTVPKILQTYPERHVARESCH